MEDIRANNQLRNENPKVYNALNFTGNELLKDMYYIDLEYVANTSFDTMSNKINTINNIKTPVYKSIFNKMRDVNFECILHSWAPDSYKYIAYKKELDNITFKRPEVVDIMPINNEDTINLEQFWYYIANRTYQIKLKCFYNIEKLIDTTNNKDANFYLSLDKTIRSGAAELYSFISEIGKVISDVSAEYLNSRFVTEVAEEIASSLSLLEYVKKDIFPLSGTFATFNNKVLQKYSSDEILNTKLLDDIIRKLSDTIVSLHNNNECYPNEEYYNDCLNIFNMFRKCFSSLTSNINQDDQELLLNDFGDDINTNTIQWSKEKLLQKWQNNQIINELTRKNNNVTLTQLLNHFVDKISLETTNTIRNITNDVINKVPNDCLSLYEIFNKHINDFIETIQPMTESISEFLNNEFQNNKELQKNPSIPHFIGNLALNIKERFNNIKNYEKERQEREKNNKKLQLKSK